MLQTNMLFSITELSNLTGKTRPTIYKYVNSYDNGELDSVPYSFIQLFNLMSKPNVKRNEIVTFCKANFLKEEKDSESEEFVKFLKENREKIDLNRVKEIIEEEIKNGGSK